MREVSSGKELIPAWPTHSIPARTATHALRSRIKEMHINPVSTIIRAGGTAGRHRPAVDWLSDSGGRKIALANSLIWSQTTLERGSQVTTPAAWSVEEDIIRAGLSEMIVWDALAAEAANSRTNTAKVFSLPPDKFSPAPNNKNEALYYFLAKTRPPW